MKKIILILQALINSIIFLILINSRIVYAAVDLSKPIPGAEPITLFELTYIVGLIGNFFVMVAPVLLIISLVLSGITFAVAGPNANAVAKAKKWLGYSVVGGLVIFGSGVIINTIAFIVTRDFFCQVVLFGVCLFH